MSIANTPDEFDILRNVVDQLKVLPSEDQERIIKWACEKLGIVEPIRQSPSAVTSQVPTSLADNSTVVTTNIKSFVDEKSPQSDIHFAVVVTYFYRFLAPEKKESITSDDLQEATRLCGRARLTVPSKTLSNAVFNGLLDSAGRGLWKINTVGENLVAIVLPGESKNNLALKRKSIRKIATKPKTAARKKK